MIPDYPTMDIQNPELNNFQTKKLTVRAVSLFLKLILGPLTNLNIGKLKPRSAFSPINVRPTW